MLKNLMNTQYTNSSGLISISVWLKSAFSLHVDTRDEE